MVCVTETAKPCGSRALGSRFGPSHSAEWRVLPPSSPPALHPPCAPNSSGMSVTELLVSVTSTILFLLSTWIRDTVRRKMFSLCVCTEQGFTWQRLLAFNIEWRDGESERAENSCGGVSQEKEARGTMDNECGCGSDCRDDAHQVWTEEVFCEPARLTLLLTWTSGMWPRGKRWLCNVLLAAAAVCL